MKRKYATGESDSAILFVGEEVEHTPAHGLRTLFVVGVQDVDKISSSFTHRVCKHIYFGANQSYAGPSHEWENMIIPFLEKGILCTLDFDISVIEEFTHSPLTAFNNFIPMISVKLPYIRSLGYNATLKLDDKDFAATNPGVWCHSVHNLQKREVFTDWSKYTKDEVIK